MNDETSHKNTSFENEVKHAFEHMNPSAEAQKRMLDNILATTSESEPQPVIKRPAWKTVLPIAASLILLAGIGFFALSGILQNTTQSAMYETVAGGSASDSTESNAAEEGEESAKALDEDSDTAPLISDSIENASVISIANEYPSIESSSLGTLHIIDEKVGGSSTLDESLVGDELEQAKARNSEKTQTMPCIIYRYGSSDSGYYAIQYEGDSAYYLAAVA